jgi:tetratricopeptide (TPR) repeat protein
MYYAYDMSKQNRGKKRMIISIAAVVVLIAGASIYWWLANHRSANEKAATQADTSYLQAGQVSFSQADYLELNAKVRQLVKDNKKSDAVALLAGRAKQVKDATQKVKILDQNASVLVQNGLTDEALKSAKEADSIKSTTATLMQIATVYGAKQDAQQQIDYINKAIQAIDNDASIDASLKPNLKSGYQQTIESIKAGGKGI